MYLMWFGVAGAAATVVSWALRATVLSRAIAGLSSAGAGYLAAFMLFIRFIPPGDSMPMLMIGVLGAGPLGALLSLALAIKLTDARDGSRAMLTAAAWTAVA